MDLSPGVTPHPPRRGVRRQKQSGAQSQFSDGQSLAFLGTAEVVAFEPIPWGSNYTFSVTLRSGTDERLAVYKPRRGEVPLWDFPDGTLYKREAASYVISQWLGWSFVPPTTIRNGPYGVGSFQLYVEPDPAGLMPERSTKYLDDLRRVALFDSITNNADRKLGHCFVGSDGRLWAIDHGLTFNIAPKHRTVIWAFCGDPIAPALLADLERVRRELDTGSLQPALSELLTPAEITAFAARTANVIRAAHFPRLDPDRNIPRGFW